MSRIGLIINPAAGRGRGAQRAPEARAAFAAVGVGGCEVTAAPGDERRAVRRVLDGGCDTIAVLGGDGTWSKVAGALLELGADCRLALLAAGTGNDFVKSVGIPATSFRRMARLAADGPEVRVDAGRVDGGHFMNVLGFGFDATVLAESRRESLLRGQALYVGTALRQLFSYRGMELGIDGSRGSPLRRWLLLAIANGRYYGGAFRIAPNAIVDDGELDVVAIADASPLRRARLFTAALRGAHVGLPEVSTGRSGTITLRFREPPAFQADGELRLASAAELEVACLPRALRLVVQPAVR